jgi:hypothetical protein
MFLNGALTKIDSNLCSEILHERNFFINSVMLLASFVNMQTTSDLCANCGGQHLYQHLGSENELLSTWMNRQASPRVPNHCRETCVLCANAKVGRKLERET